MFTYLPIFTNKYKQIIYIQMYMYKDRFIYIILTWLAKTPDGINREASFPNISLAKVSSSLTLGSSPNS